MSTHKQIPWAILAIVAAVALVSCAGAPGENMAAANEVTAAFAAAYDAGDAPALAALYAEDAHSLPPGTDEIQGRSAIEAYWKADIGTGGARTTMTPTGSIAQGDLLSVDGTYQVTAKEGDVPLARGQFTQLWERIGGAWRVAHEIWRLDPSMQRNLDTAKRLSSLWTTAYNAGDVNALTELYDDDAVLAPRPGGNVVGRKAIVSFWSEDFGKNKPSTKLTLTDAYMAGELAHLEGEYEVDDKGELTVGHYVQLWMHDGSAWRIHREMWLQ
jgi:ketosteroid isomerase-like protein